MKVMVLCFCVLLSACTTQIKPKNMKSIDDTLNKLVQEGKTPSVQYLLFDQDKILHQFKSGYADLAGEEKTDDKTMYHAFSVTKTFTASPAMSTANCCAMAAPTATTKTSTQANDIFFSDLFSFQTTKPLLLSIYV